MDATVASRGGEKPQDLLEALDNLDEYVIKSIRFGRYQTKLTLAVESPHREGSIPGTFRLVFDLVREVVFKNGLNSSMVAEPTRMNWVMNEIALAEVISDSPLAAEYSEETPKPFHVALVWNSPTEAHERRIDVVASSLHVEPIRAT